MSLSVSRSFFDCLCASVSLMNVSFLCFVRLSCVTIMRMEVVVASKWVVCTPLFVCSVQRTFELRRLTLAFAENENLRLDLRVAHVQRNFSCLCENYEMSQDGKGKRWEV